MELVRPTVVQLPGYVAALRTGWSADNLRGELAAKEELGRIESDPDRFLASLHDPDARGDQITLSDGSKVARIPGYIKWMWDGDFCGSIGLRWVPGERDVPSYVLGHVGYTVVPWKRGRGYAKQALKAILPEAKSLGLEYVREAVLRLPALLPVVYRVPVSKRARGPQLQGILHPGPPDVLFGGGTEPAAEGRRLPRCDREDGAVRHARLSSSGEAAVGLNREQTLAALNDRLLREFSRRTIDELRAVLPLRLALPAFEPFLAENVAKEVRKDALVIRCAAQALATGAPPGPGTARSLLPAARDIDRELLSRTAGLPVRLEIRYDAIDYLRLRRMEAGLDTAYRILDAWQQRRQLREALMPDEIERRLFEILHLYAEETQALSDSARLPGILEPLREGLTQQLREAMLHSARVLARDAARGRRPGTRTATRTTATWGAATCPAKRCARTSRGRWRPGPR